MFKIKKHLRRRRSRGRQPNERHSSEGQSSEERSSQEDDSEKQIFLQEFNLDSMENFELNFGAIQSIRQNTPDGMTQFLTTIDYEKSDKMTDECRQGFIQSSKSWMKTEILLLSLVEVELVADIFSAMYEDSDAHSTGYEDFSSHLGCEDHHLKNLLTTPRANLKAITTKMSDSKLELKFDELYGTSLLRIEDSEFGKPLAESLEKFRILFRYLIRFEIVPCGEQVKEFLRHILIIRREEGELLSVSSASCNEILVVAENLSLDWKDEYWQARLQNCLSMYQTIKERYQKVESGLRSFEFHFSRCMADVLAHCTRINLIGREGMGAYRQFYDLNAYNLSFQYKDVHKITQAKGFEIIISWYSELKTQEISEMLTEDLDTLITSHMLLGRMIRVIHHDIFIVCRGLTSSLPNLKNKVLSEVSMERCVSRTSSLSIYSSLSDESSEESEQPKKRKRNLFKKF